MSNKNKLQNSHVVLVNTLITEPQNQEALLAILRDGAETIMPKHVGYLGSTIYKGKDGKTVVVLAHWRSPKDIEAVRSNSENAAYLTKIQSLAKASPSLFESYFVHETNESQ